MRCEGDTGGLRVSRNRSSSRSITLAQGKTNYHGSLSPFVHSHCFETFPWTPIVDLSGGSANSAKQFRPLQRSDKVRARLGANIGEVGKKNNATGGSLIALGEFRWTCS